jgi:hypothetical protein
MEGSQPFITLVMLIIYLLILGSSQGIAANGDMGGVRVHTHGKLRRFIEIERGQESCFY